MDDVCNPSGPSAIGFLEPDLIAKCESSGSDTTWDNNIARVVEAEIIPRLMLAYRNEPQPASARRAPTEAEITAFASLVLAPADEDVSARICALAEGGLSVDSLLLDLLAPTARHLGLLWEEDICDFAELTLAMGRLQRAVHDLGLRYGGMRGRLTEGPRILLCPCPGETHVFGLTMVQRFFGDAGWTVACTALDPEADPVALAGAGWFDVIGFTLGAEVRVPAAQKLVHDLRWRSLNPRVAVIVGGSLVTGDPGLARRLGADAHASDARSAVHIAESLLEMRARAC